MWDSDKQIRRFFPLISVSRIRRVFTIHHLMKMTDNGSIEKVEPNIEQNNNYIVIQGVTETETNDFLEESDVSEIKETTTDFESDSDVINSFIQNTSREVGYVFQFKYILRYNCHK